MNIAAIESMENFAEQVLSLPEESRNDFFERLKAFASEDEILTLKKCVGLYRMMNDYTLYKAIEKTVGEQIYNEFNE